MLLHHESKVMGREEIQQPEVYSVAFATLLSLPGFVPPIIYRTLIGVLSSHKYIDTVGEYNNSMVYTMYSILYYSF